jgi:hypothetical protein
MIDLMSDSVFWLFLCWIFLSPVLCFFLARSRNRSSLFWVLAGLIFGFISVIVLYFLPKLEKQYYVDKKDRVDSKVKMYENLKEFEETKSKSN